MSPPLVKQEGSGQEKTVEYLLTPREDSGSPLDTLGYSPTHIKEDTGRRARQPHRPYSSQKRLEHDTNEFSTVFARAKLPQIQRENKYPAGPHSPQHNTSWPSPVGTNKTRKMKRTRTNVATRFVVTLKKKLLPTGLLNPMILQKTTSIWAVSAYLKPETGFVR